MDPSRPSKVLARCGSSFGSQWGPQGKTFPGFPPVAACLAAQVRDQAGANEGGLAAPRGADDGDQGVAVDGLCQVFEVRLPAEVKAGILLAEDAQAPVGADAGARVGVCRVVEFGRRLAADRAGDQIRRSRVPSPRPKCSGAGRRARPSSRYSGRAAPGSQVPACRPWMPCSGGPGPPPPRAVARDRGRCGHGHGDGPARGEISLQGRGPGLAGAEIPVVLKYLEPPIAERLGQGIDITPVEPVVAQEEVERGGRFVHGSISTQ